MAQTKYSGGVVVAGDVTMDWNLARSRTTPGWGAAWNAEDCTRAYLQHGGAALLADVIEAVAAELRRAAGVTYEVRRPVVPKRAVRPGDPQFHHSYAMWLPFKYGERAPADKEKKAWRVEEFLGLDRCLSAGHAVADDNPEADLLVLDDANLGFRDKSELWPQALTAKRRPPWVLVKMSPPVAHGPLWEHLHSRCGERLVVVMTVNDLRLTEVQVSRELSWERAAQDLAWELVYNPRVNSLSQCAHVVISFDAAGALLLSKAEGESAAPKCSLFFDPAVIEGMWEQEHKGQMLGHTVCLAAGLARELMVSPDAPDVRRGVRRGLAAMRRLHLEGYGRRGEPASQARLAFPTDLVARALAQEEEHSEFAEAEVQDPARFLASTRPAGEKRAREAGFWTILEDRYTETLDEVAERVVLEGAEAALKDVPLGRFGKLLTVDRREIESFRSIRSLISEYCRLGRPKRPLSIAVFGPPGAGKSFGIVEVAKSLRPDEIEVREFNLSQFGSPEEILDALHQVRDVGLSGRIPLVFWDEFDSSLNGQALGWLRYFLAPMQDGRFQQGQLTHPTGRAIFVFAGGTSESMEAFDRGAGDAEFKAVKGPDFVSRLKGYVNILGPNRKEAAAGSSDPYYIIRRAILLRSMLARDAPQLFHKDDTGKGELLRIDRGVLRALLQTRRYKHGARSMESVIAMSLLGGKSTFERSSLPAEAQLDLHVDAQDFLARVRRLDEALSERLAEAAHEVFCDGLRAKGYRFGPDNDDRLKTSSALRPYAELTDDEKEQNRTNVRDIAQKLAAAGYVMTPARSDEPPFDFPGPGLEQLAEAEHDRWLRQKLEGGWRYGPRTDKEKRLHSALRPWRKLSGDERARLYSAYAAAVGDGALSEEEKEKDRVLVRGIPRILARAGYTVVKVRGDNANNSPKEESRNGQDRSHGAPRSRRAGQNRRGNRKSPRKS